MSDRSLMLMAATVGALVVLGLGAGLVFLRTRMPNRVDPVGTVVAGIPGESGPGGSKSTATSVDRGGAASARYAARDGSPENRDASAAVVPESGRHDEITTTVSADVSAPAASTPDHDGAGRVGVIAGHWQYDTGAVCADGRREVDVTKDVAMRVRAILEVRGFDVDLLPEHDPTVPQPPLQNYLADAVVSIHADSCEYSGVSGYKVARWAYSEMPAEEDRLVACLYDEYGKSTLMQRHDDTLTADMWDYYAFRELAVDTPAAIIELGFLGADRVALDELRYEMATGIANGISCFLDRPTE